MEMSSFSEGERIKFIYLFIYLFIPFEDFTSILVSPGSVTSPSQGESSDGHRLWRNHIQRVKIEIDDSIIEQVTDFKYLGYRISEYGSDLEDKLQTYSKINGAVWRHFGKQMNKETKLRIHNITAKAALKFGSESWVLKKREEQRLEPAQM